MRLPYLKQTATFLLVSLLLHALPAMAQIHITAPASAPQGTAVLVRFTSDTPEQTLTVEWLGKRFAVQMSADSSGSSASAIIPMPLEGTDTLDLLAQAADGAKAETSIATEHVAWPRQEIRVDSKYVDPPAEVRERISREQRETRKVLETISPEQHWQLPFVKPVTGDVTSVFGGLRVLNGEPRSRHRGTDLRGATGTPIHAMASGVVALAKDQYFSGNVVYIDHGQGFISLYAHMSKLDVSAGQQVKAGQVIGQVGATGRVTGPHLHWGVLILGNPVDPMSLLAFQ